MADYLPKFKPGQAVTFKASAAITGGQIVEITGDRTVAPAGADSAKVVGVAGFDAAIGEDVTVFNGGVQRFTAAAAVAAGAVVTAAASGKATSGGTNKIGIALEAAAAADDVFDVLV